MILNEIPRCYDSHLHLLSTGQMQCLLDLRTLTDPRDLQKLNVKPSFFRKDWLVGFGWNHHQFPNQSFPNRFQLDQFFPDFPVAFSRGDGHCMWVNTKALEICDLLKPVADWNLPPGAEAHQDQKGMPTGILVDRAMDAIFAKIPAPSDQDVRSWLLEGSRVLNQNGFTHVRDMAGNEQQWKILRELDDQGELTLYVEQNFSFEAENDFEKALQASIHASRDQTSHLRAMGIKFYVDGALGSDGALLSQCYLGSQSKGLQLWSVEQIEFWMRSAWQNQLEVSIHALGDGASELVAQVATRLWDEGLAGKLNIEHAEVMNKRTFQLLKGRNVAIHFQPCHWLTDRAWLEKKLGHLYSFAFPWAEAQRLGIALSWGSDSPIELPNIFLNQKALELSKDFGIAAYQGDWWKPHSHPDPLWGSGCKTQFRGDQIEGVFFDHRALNV